MISLSLSLSLCVYIYINIHIYIYVCIYIYIYTHIFSIYIYITVLPELWNNALNNGASSRVLRITLTQLKGKMAWDFRTRIQHHLSPWYKVAGEFLFLWSLNSANAKSESALCLKDRSCPRQWTTLWNLICCATPYCRTCLFLKWLIICPGIIIKSFPLQRWTSRPKLFLDKHTFYYIAPKNVRI